jgi:hypothetical protein
VGRDSSTEGVVPGEFLLGSRSDPSKASEIKACLLELWADHSGCSNAIRGTNCSAEAVYVAFPRCRGFRYHTGRATAREKSAHWVR